MPSPPRTFTRHQLLHGITTAEYAAMSSEDQQAFNKGLLAIWSHDDHYVQGDYDLIASNRRFELGE